MKKSLLIIAAGLILSANVFAVEYTQETSSKSLQSQSFETKQQAYNAGFTIVDELKLASNQELRSELATNFADNISIQDAAVMIEELSDAEGHIQYRAVVDIDYSYEQDVYDNSDD